MSTVDEILSLTGPAVLLPISKGEKGPRIKGWQTLTLEDMTPEHLAGLNHGNNIGAVLGDASQGLCTIDADTAEGLESFLDANPGFRESLITQGARGGNVWLRIRGTYPKSSKLNLSGQPFGEWRAKGNQTVIHGTHPSGCEYRRNGKKVLEVVFEEIQWPAGIALPWVKEPESTVVDYSECTPNDAGRAERFVNRYGHDVRYVPDRGIWLTWDNGRWTLDRDGALERLAVQLSKEMLCDVAKIPGTDDAAAKQRANACREALACGDRRNISDFMGLAQVDKRVLLPVAHLDADKWIVGAKNAVIDLKTGEVRDYTRADYLTKTLGCDADPTATCTRWERFMEEVFPDEEVRRFVWKAAGHSLTGDMREQCFFFLYGTGHNGKSKFMETLEFIFGTCATRAGKGIVAASQRGEYPLREVADLAGARMVLTSETEEGERLNEGVIKDLTGGDSLRAEHKYERAFVFQPSCKLWIIGNHKPGIKGTDGGIWRRVRLVPFTQKFEGTADDKNLGETLKSEASGILNWLVKGCLLWQSEGLEAPEAVKAATEDYRTEEDTLADFISECTREAKDAFAGHGAIYRTYREWADQSGIRFAITSKILAKRLRERGWRDGFDSRKNKVWHNVEIAENAG